MLGFWVVTTRRPKPPQTQWLIEQRKRRGWKPEDVASRMDVAVPTVRGWESGRGIGPDSITRLEALFGVSAPGHSEQAGSDLAAAIMALTRELQAAREERAAVARRLDEMEAVLDGLVERARRDGGGLPSPLRTLGSS